MNLTNKEAVEHLKYIAREDDSHITTADIEAIEMAIAALKAEPCEDAVKREAVRDMVCEIRCRNERSKCVLRNICKYMNHVSALPSVTPLPDKIDGMLEDAYEHGYQQARHDYESEPCEDAVSREAVLDAIDKWVKDKSTFIALAINEGMSLLERIKALPPVAPKPTECEDCVSREAVLDALHVEGRPTKRFDYVIEVRRDIEALPPVTPKQKTGKWIDDKCSVCGKGIEDLISSPEWYRNEEPKFCPMCGVKDGGRINGRV